MPHHEMLYRTLPSVAAVVIAYPKYRALAPSRRYIPIFGRREGAGSTPAGYLYETPGYMFGVPLGEVAQWVEPKSRRFESALRPEASICEI